MGTAVGLLLVIAALVSVALVRRAHADETFADITPGLLPSPGAPVRRRRLARGETAPIAVQFTPPSGVTPGLVGTVIDNRVNPVDISATLIDLAVRGWFRLRRLGQDQIPASAEKRGKATKADWELVRAEQPPSGDRLSEAEQLLVSGLFAKAASVTLSELRATHGGLLRKVIVALYAETVARGWFLRHPKQRAKSWVWLGGTLLVVGVALVPISILLLDLSLAAVGLAVAGAILIAGTRGLTTPLTAEGYALRVQALGFKQYLATAEADQLRFEAGADIYSRYLPYAMVFGVVDHWNQVFADVVRARRDPGVLDADFGDALLLAWIDLPSLDLFVLGGGDGDFFGEGASSLVDGLDSVGDALGSLTDGLGDFAESVGDLLGGLGDLVDGCGCDF